MPKHRSGPPSDDMTNPGLAKMLSILRRPGQMCLVFAIGFFLVTGAQAAMLPNQRLAFDHLTTGFALTGRHEFVACEACHVGGVFKGTPKQCAGCHNAVTARGKPPNHIPTSASCDACHDVTFNFGNRTKMDHSTTAVPCAACHNGTHAGGKPASHMPTSSLCVSCHRPGVRWVAFQVDHFEVRSSCSGCHNGTTAGVKTFRPVNHIPISGPNLCDNCHDAPPAGALWRVIIVDHSQVSTNCVGCHISGNSYGVDTFKSVTHPDTSNFCASCHSSGPPGKWRPVLRVDHGHVFRNSCSSCHDGSIARGKGINHFVTRFECDDCHQVQGWIPAAFAHSAIARYATHAKVTCTMCHITQPPTVAAKKPWQYSSCASCHADDYVQGHGGTTATVPTDRDNCQPCHYSTSSNW